MRKYLGIILFSLLLGYLTFGNVFAQTTHGITVSWTESNNSDPAAGFNVYRATVAGGPYTKITATQLASTQLSYFDSTVAGGTKYFYVVAAVDSLGIQSPNSNEVSGTALAGAPNPPVATGAVAQ